MRLPSSFATSLLFTSLACLAACGTEGMSVFDDGVLDNAEVPVGDPRSFQDDGGAGDGGAGDGGAQGDGGACAATNAEAKLTPVDMIVMYDRSGSMGDTNEDPSYDPAKKWIPVGEAMKAFFADPQSAGMRAALTFFPTLTNSCDANDYDTPDVPLTDLPSGAFATAIDAADPKGDTPSRACVAGAIVQAQAVAAAHPTDETVIVLVTDGDPYGCGINTAPQSAAEASLVASDVAAVKATLPTYVIGVGPSVDKINAVATAGGTTAFQVSVGTPTKTTADLIAAFAKIRGELGRCDFDIPAPPDGRTLDFDKVNVEVVHPGKPNETLVYSADCASGKGWHFDDPANPKKVLLCDATCDAVKSEAGGKVNVSFGCVDRPDVVH